MAVFALRPFACGRMRVRQAVGQLDEARIAEDEDVAGGKIVGLRAIAQRVKLDGEGLRARQVDLHIGRASPAADIFREPQHAVHINIDVHIRCRPCVSAARAEGAAEHVIALAVDVPRDAGIVRKLLAVVAVDKGLPVFHFQRTLCLSKGLAVDLADLCGDQRFHCQPLVERDLIIRRAVVVDMAVTPDLVVVAAVFVHKMDAGGRIRHCDRQLVLSVALIADFLRGGVLRICEIAEVGVLILRVDLDGGALRELRVAEGDDVAIGPVSGIAFRNGFVQILRVELDGQAAHAGQIQVHIHAPGLSVDGHFLHDLAVCIEADSRVRFPVILLPPCNAQRRAESGEILDIERNGGIAFEIIRIDIFRLDLRVALARTVSLQLRLTIFHAIGRNAVHGEAVGELDLAAIGCDALQLLFFADILREPPALIDHEALVLAVMAAIVRIAGRPERRELADQSLGVRLIELRIIKTNDIMICPVVRLPWCAVGILRIQLDRHAANVRQIDVKVDRRRMDHFISVRADTVQIDPECCICR